MIFGMVQTSWLALRRDRAALALSFVVPIVFFSIFATIFGGRGGDDGTRKVRLLFVDEDRSDRSQRLYRALGAESALDLRPAPKAQPGEVEPAIYDRATAEAAVRGGDAPVALVVPEGFGSAQLGFGPNAERPRLELLADRSDPIAPRLVEGLLQKSLFASLATSSLPVTIEVRDLMGEHKQHPMVAFYASGLGVMFLLFSAAGAGGALIEERESGTLDRLLATRLTMTQLLAGKLLFLTSVGLVQLIVMFAWGALVFGLELEGRLVGFLLMALPTALTCSAFGLVLAAIAKTRKQLVALSNLVILSMSALGGSMFPRVLMPESLQKLSLVTFNSWALEGFLDVFWRDAPLVALVPEIAVLLAWTAGLFLIARRIARRWEIV